MKLLRSSLSALVTAAATLGATFTLGAGTAHAGVTTDTFSWNGYRVAVVMFRSSSTDYGHLGQEAVAVADVWDDDHYIITQIYDAANPHTIVGVCTALDLSNATCYYNLPEGHPISIVVWRADNATSRHLQYLGTVEDGNGYLPRA